MQTLTGPHDRINSLVDDLVNHGWGELTIKVQSLKDATIRVDIFCGRQYVSFIKKDIIRYDQTIL